MLCHFPLLLRVSLLLPALLAISGCAVGVGEGDSAPTMTNAAPSEQAIAVEVVHARTQPLSASITGTAALEARTDAQVVAKTSGIALAVLVEEGQRVRQGQPLVRLDADRARLTLEQTRAHLNKLETNTRRAQRLLQQQLVSQADVDQLRFDLDDARARHQMAELELSWTTVQAPIAGVVASRDIKPGNFVQINSPILRIVDRQHLEATLNVPERELAHIATGQAVTLEADALPGRTFNGVVERVAPVVDSGTGTFRVVATTSGNDGLQPGMFVRLGIETEQRADALVIPRGALLDEGVDVAVYVVRDGTVVRARVSTGIEQAGLVEIRSGLAPGDAVVVAGKTAVRDGTPVQVIERGDGALPAQAAGE